MNPRIFRPLPLFAVGLIVVTSFMGQAAEVEFPAASPTGTIKQRAGITDIEIVYSRPGVKDREIFGGLVPYGEVWRTGANAPTKITFSSAVIFGGENIPAGTYALYTVPGEDEWTVILSEKTDLWGAFGYDRANDFLVVSVVPGTMANSVETFTIDINDIRDESATLNLIWDTTVVSVPLEFNIVDEIVANIQAAMAEEGDDKPYYKSASFYLEHGQNLEEAGAWIDAAIEANPDRYYIYFVKARIEAERGNIDAAIAASEKSLELATAANNGGYVTQNEELLASLR